MSYLPIFWVYCFFFLKLLSDLYAIDQNSFLESGEESALLSSLNTTLNSNSLCTPDQRITKDEV